MHRGNILKSVHASRTFYKIVAVSMIGIGSALSAVSKLSIVTRDSVTGGKNA
jgi:hypothetical protein